MEACIAGVSKCQMANKLHKLAFYEWKKAREKKIYETDKMKKKITTSTANALGLTFCQ